MKTENTMFHRPMKVCPECGGKLGKQEKGWFEDIHLTHYHCLSCLRHYLHGDLVAIFLARELDELKERYYGERSI